MGTRSEGTVHVGAETLADDVRLMLLLLPNATTTIEKILSSFFIMENTKN